MFPEIVVLMQSETKKVEMADVMLPIELDIGIKVIKIPLNKKLKRKHRKILQTIYDEHAFLLSDISAFKTFCKGECQKSFMHFYPKECIDFFRQNKANDDVAFYVDCVTEYAKYVLKLFGKYFQCITVYTPMPDKLIELEEKFFSDFGMPLRIKKYNAEECVGERYLVVLNKSIYIKDLQQKKEIRDVKITFLSPLNQFLFLPLLDILKIVEENGMCGNLVNMHKVKIVGEISK